MSQNLTIKRHAALVDRMAGTLGLDLEEEMLAGQLDPDMLCDVVLRCTGCSNPEGCEAWMDEVSHIAKEAPIMCRNGHVFAALKDGQRV